MKRVRKPSARVAAVGAEAMGAVVAAVAVEAIAADVVAAVADAAVIAATVVTAATAGKIPHLSLIRSLTSGALFLRPKSFAFEPSLHTQNSQPSGICSSQPGGFRVVSRPIGLGLHPWIQCGPRLRSSAPACPSPPAAETFSGLACLIQQAKKLFHSWRLEIYQEVLAQEFSGKSGLAPGGV